jgi:hypothetical protein
VTQHNRNSRSKTLNSIQGLTTKAGAKIAPGTRIRFFRGDGTIQSDVIREIFWQETTTEKGMALVLTSHSWCWTKDVVDITP